MLCFSLLLLKSSGLYDNFKLPLTCNGKIEKWHLLVSHCIYFDKTFIEMFLEWSSTRQIILCPVLILIVAMATKNAKKGKIFLKIISSETIWNIGLRFCRNILGISLNKFYVFHCYCSKALVCINL